MSFHHQRIIVLDCNPIRRVDWGFVESLRTVTLPVSSGHLNSKQIGSELAQIRGTWAPLLLLISCFDPLPESHLDCYTLELICTSTRDFAHIDFVAVVNVYARVRPLQEQIFYRSSGLHVRGFSAKALKITASGSC